MCKVFTFPATYYIFNLHKNCIFFYHTGTSLHTIWSIIHQSKCLIENSVYLYLNCTHSVYILWSFCVYWSSSAVCVILSYNSRCCSRVRPCTHIMFFLVFFCNFFVKLFCWESRSEAFRVRLSLGYWPPNKSSWCTTNTLRHTFTIE